MMASGRGSVALASQQALVGGDAVQAGALLNRERRPERIQQLLAQACQGHDDEACGAHDTAAETFRPADGAEVDGGTN
ncbi:MAG: hypothetical protein IT370_34185 [Deltaproteobacteria bacterium]|nr:hypothetical protein [Deltaproteobacteria bacterium]